jgi:hypothetical protein
MSKILPSEIAKHGNAADRSFLSGIQIASRQTAKRNRQLKDAPKYPQRQKQRQRKQQRLNSTWGGFANQQVFNGRQHEEDRAAGRHVPDIVTDVNRDVETSPR